MVPKKVSFCVTEASTFVTNPLWAISPPMSHSFTAITAEGAARTRFSGWKSAPCRRERTH